MKSINLKAKERKPEKTKNKELRRNNQIPAVLYGHQVKNHSLTLNAKRFAKVYQKTGTSSLIDLKIGKKKPVKVIVQEIQSDPVSDQVIHVDFYQIKMDQKLKTEIPLKFINSAPAVEDEGGNLIIDRENIEVECLPKDLIDEIEIDISVLKSFDDVIRIKDLDIPKKIKILDKKDDVIVTTTAPRTEEELEALEEAPTESDVEEVEVEKEKEEEEEGTESEEIDEKNKERSEKEGPEKVNKDKK